MTRKAMLIDLNRCAGCYACVVACEMQNNPHPDASWVTVERCEWGDYPDAGRTYLPHSCMQCDDPPCVSACPTGASYQHEDKTTLVEYEDCICCGQCVAACPYGARHITRGGYFFDAAEPSPYEAVDPIPENVAEKCTFCNQLTSEGGQPACVVNCPGRARIFGDIEDTESDIAKKLDKATRVGQTGFYYIQPAGMPSDMIRNMVMVASQNPITDTTANAEKTSAGISTAAVAGCVAAVAVVGVGAGVGISHLNKRKRIEAAKSGKGTGANGGSKDE